MLVLEKKLTNKITNINTLKAVISKFSKFKTELSSEYREIVSVALIKSGDKYLCAEEQILPTAHIEFEDNNGNRYAAIRKSLKRMLKKQFSYDLKEDKIIALINPMRGINKDLFIVLYLIEVTENEINPNGFDWITYKQLCKIPGYGLKKLEVKHEHNV